MIMGDRLPSFLVEVVASSAAEVPPVAALVVAALVEVALEEAGNQESDFVNE